MLPERAITCIRRADSSCRERVDVESKPSGRAPATGVAGSAIAVLPRRGSCSAPGMFRLASTLAATLLATACVASDGDESGEYDADPSDFPDGKADGVSGSSQAALDLIDGAKTRVLAQIPTLTDKKLLTSLRAAAARGVDVHAYLVVPAAAHPATVLASEQLEAAGVDICVERTSRLKGFLLVADDTLLDAGANVTTASKVSAAADKFTAVVAEDTSDTPPALGADDTALMLMPDSHVGPIVKLLERASSSIDLEIYQLQSPAVIAALAAARERGVTVRVMVEPRTVGDQNAKQVKAQLAAAGITVKDTPPAFDSSHNVDHAKFMLLDGAELVFGSGNLVRSGTGGNAALEFDNRDFWMRDRRSASVTEASAVFEADWNRKSTTSTAFEQLVLTPDNADERVLALIRGATTRVFVYNQSLAHQAVQDALAERKAAGVDVRVLLGLQPGFGGAAPANQPAIVDLTSRGVSAAFFTKHYLHGKVVVADDQVFVGSQNFTNGGLGKNRELGEVFDAKPIVDGLARQFLDDQASPNP
jgi:cardiolipin synthase A/B